MITVHCLGARRTDGLDQDIAYSVDIERSGGRFDNAPEVREAPLRVTHLVPPGGGQGLGQSRRAGFLLPVTV
jgi:hypothetical protein